MSTCWFQTKADLHHRRIADHLRRHFEVTKFEVTKWVFHPSIFAGEPITARFILHCL
jgi:hypothetical protein